jgi:hypothetical protein
MPTTLIMRAGFFLTRSRGCGGATGIYPRRLRGLIYKAKDGREVLDMVDHFFATEQAGEQPATNEEMIAA